MVRAMDINANTSIWKGRSMVFAKISYKNLVYTTKQVIDMGQIPFWDDDGTNVCHFEFTNSSEYITLKLYNRNESNFIGECKLQLSELLRLYPGKPEAKTLPVMMRQKHAGEVEVKVEIMEHMAMGELGILSVEIKKGEIPKLTSVLVKTAKIFAKLIYKHTTYTSGVLDKAGSKFVWHKDNTFIFIINSFNSSDDVLKLEIYNSHTKGENLVGECKVSMSSFIEDKHVQGFPSDWVAHSPELSLPSRSKVVGNIEMRARFTSGEQPCRRTSLNPMEHHPPTSTHGQYPYPQVQPWRPYPMQDHFPPAPFPPGFPQLPQPHSRPPNLYPPQVPLGPSIFNPRPSAPTGTFPYPPPHGAHGHPGRPFNPQLQPVYPSPSAPAFPRDFEIIHGAPDPTLQVDAEIEAYKSSFH